VSVKKIANEMIEIANQLEEDAKNSFVSEDKATNYITLFYIAIEKIREWAEKLAQEDG